MRVNCQSILILPSFTLSLGLALSPLRPPGLRASNLSLRSRPSVSRFPPSHNKARVCIEIGLIKEPLPNRVLIGSTVYVWITSKKSLI